MAIEFTWLGHGTWLIDVDLPSGKHAILLDPFLDESPTAPIKADAVRADTILVSHGHFDHVADCVNVAKRTGAKVVAIYEICTWLEQHGVENTDPHNLGGGSEQAFGRVEFTLAHHSSMLPDGSYGGAPAGFLLSIQGKTIYFACDTALFEDMRLIGDRGIDLAVLPIGDRFTMGPEDAVRAVELIRPKMVAPAHYNTWPPIEQDANQWADAVRSKTKAEPKVLEPGESFRLET